MAKFSDRIKKFGKILFTDEQDKTAKNRIEKN